MRLQPGARLLHLGERAGLISLELAEPTRHLTGEVTVGPAEVVEAAASPIEGVNPGQRVDEGFTAGARRALVLRQRRR